MSLVKTPADDSKTAAAEDHEVAAATKSGRPTTKDAALLAFVSSIGPFAANAYVPAFDEILKTVESTLSQIRRRRARGTSGLWPSSP